MSLPNRRTRPCIFCGLCREEHPQEHVYYPTLIGRAKKEKIYFPYFTLLNLSSDKHSLGVLRAYRFRLISDGFNTLFDIDIEAQELNGTTWKTVYSATTLRILANIPLDDILYTHRRSEKCLL